MPDDLWIDIKIILLGEKPDNTMGRPMFHIERYLTVSYLY